MYAKLTLSSFACVQCLAGCHLEGRVSGSMYERPARLLLMLLASLHACPCLLFGGVVQFARGHGVTHSLSGWRSQLCPCAVSS